MQATLGVGPMKTLAVDRWKNEILRRVMIVRPDSARRWGRMSAHQMICHVNDCLRVAIGQKPVSAATGPVQRTVLKWIALYLPLPWPPGIPTRPEVDQQSGGTRPADFAADVAELRALVEIVAGRDPGENWPAHPVFGRMSRAAWLRWGYLHTDHHLRQFGA
jgi:uncharacterized protein DUF1569